MRKFNACRMCGGQAATSFLDLGMQPKCQDDLTEDRMNQMQPHFPLEAFVCHECLLVQLNDIVGPSELFSEYSYFSSNSKSWLKHAEKYVEKILKRFNLDSTQQVIEIASNDGYLLQFFKEKNIPVLGIEPARNVAEYAIREKGINTINKFFGFETACEVKDKFGRADLLLGNNVIAHVPDINDFVRGLKTLLKPNGIITIEFQHLLELVKKNHFDYIMDEHFTYYSFTVFRKLFAKHGLKIFDVESLKTHGGSLRIYAAHDENDNYPILGTVGKLLEIEDEAGINDLSYYQNFKHKVRDTKRKILTFLIDAKRNHKKIAGYGAPGKGNILLNYCGIGPDFIDFTVDINPLKQGKFLPGSLIPIYHPDKIEEEKPDYVFILPWNIKDEIQEQVSFIRNWGGKFVVPIPELKIID